MEERLSAAGGELLAEVRAGVATVTLNRPAALNALTFGMLQGLDEWLTRWEHDPAVRLVVLRGAGDKAFCAGGDVRGLHQQVTSGDGRHHTFFEVEYALDYRIYGYPKTVVALLDGIVMGGGMGISQGARVRIVGPRTRMAMPETAIGLFPDVGASHFLSRCPGEVGIYLGLVGPTINAADAVYANLADLNVSPGDAPPGELAGLREAIDRHFAHASVAAIIASLAAEKDPRFAEWATKTVAAFAKKSPTLLCVALEQLRRGRSLSLADCFRLELNLINRCFEQGDFVEGIRALLVDKDNQPRWSPPRLEEVKDSDIDSFFAPRWTPQRHPLAALA